MTVRPSLTIYRGGSVTLSCSVDGSKPIYFEWYQGRNPLKNEKATTVILNNLQPNASGLYKCVVSNGAGKKSTKESYINIQCKFCLCQLNFVLF